MTSTKQLLKPTLFTTIGGSGSSKSHFTSLLAKEIQVVRLNNDAMRSAPFDEPTLLENLHNYRLVYGAMDYAAKASLKAGASVIYDANVNQRVYRHKNAELAANEGADAIVLWIKTPFEVRGERVTNRDVTDEQSRFGEDTVRKHLNQLEEPDDTEKVIIIDGTANAEEQIKQFWQQYLSLQEVRSLYVS